MDNKQQKNKCRDKFIVHITDINKLAKLEILNHWNQLRQSRTACACKTKSTALQCLRNQGQFQNKR